MSIRLTAFRPVPLVHRLWSAAVTFFAGLQPQTQALALAGAFLAVFIGIPAGLAALFG